MKQIQAALADIQDQLKHKSWIPVRGAVEIFNRSKGKVEIALNTGK